MDKMWRQNRKKLKNIEELFTEEGSNPKVRLYNFEAIYIFFVFSSIKFKINFIFMLKNSVSFSTLFQFF